MTTENSSASPLPPDRYIEAGATVCNSPALLLSKILRSPNVAKVMSAPPSWVNRAELVATVAAIHRAARAFDTASAAHEREDAEVVGAVASQLGPEWTVRKAADYLRLSERRVQEMATELGGRRVGRQWLLDEVAVRHEHQRRRQAAA